MYKSKKESFFLFVLILLFVFISNYHLIAAASINDIEDSMESYDTNVRRNALRSTRNIDDTDIVIDILINALSDSENEVRKLALDLLAERGIEAEKARSAVAMLAIDDRDNMLSFNAILALHQIDPELRGLWGQGIKDKLKGLQTKNLERKDDLIIAVIETSESLLDDVEINIYADIYETHYNRDGRGSLQLRERKTDSISLIDKNINKSLSNSIYNIEIPIPYSQENNYIDGRIDINLSFQHQKYDLDVFMTEKSLAFNYGEPSFKIRPDITYQNIDGFSASGAWWAQHLGKWEEAREEIADLLFSKDIGIGLSQYRYYLGGGINSSINDHWRTADTYAVDYGEYDWSRDPGGRWFLNAAIERGVGELILFLKSPPYFMTKNNQTYAEQGANTNLSPDRYSDFAHYLADVHKYFADEKDIHFDWVSPINEPEWSWDSASQEGSPYTVNQIRNLSRVIIKTFVERDLDTNILIPEAGKWEFLYGDGRNYADNLFSDPLINEHISTLAVHSYWSGNTQRYLAGSKMEKYPEKTIWQTEWCEMVHGKELGMDSALNMAKVIHADLTLANVSAWHYWLAVSRYDYRDGLIYVNPDNREIEEAKNLWVLGNYSRFIRPGARRIDVEANHRSRENVEAGIALSAYYDEIQGQYIIVAINEVPDDKEIDLQIITDKTALKLLPYETSAEKSLEKLSAIELEDRGNSIQGKKVNLSAQSVTTFVIKL
ncbi:glycoside hydrolase [Natronospora cellulosivora (SeqCode)]